MDEQSLPGIGYRYEIEAEGGPVSVCIHHSGRCDLYVGSPPVAVTLDEDQARRLGAVLTGPSGLVIESVELGLRPKSAGRTIAELEVRRRTRMTIVAIIRDRATLLSPDPDETLHGGDRVVVVGRPDDLDGLIGLLT